MNNHFTHSFSTKIKVIIVLITSSILIFAALLIVFTEYKILQKDLIYNSVLNSKLIGEYCVGYLVFDDDKGCYDILSKTESIQYIVDVTIYDTTNNEYARFSRKYPIKNKYFYEKPILNDSVYTIVNLLNIVKPIYYKNDLYGFIHLRSSYDYINSKILNYILMIGVLLCITLILTYVLASNFQKIISKPILNLAKLTNEISISGDYTRQLKITSKDEIGILYKEFNNMLVEINKRKSEREQKEQEIRKLNEELEEKVKNRTKELQVEKEKTQELLNISDHLLLNILPEPIAYRLKNGESTLADRFEQASVIFIDIVAFTDLVAKYSPEVIVKMLNKIFTEFDKITAKYGLEKIKTIGDCYMAASGIPEYREDHAESVTNMALDVIDLMKNLRTDDGNEIKFRIGLDCGPVVAGVIGEKKFIYDLWGETVNTASRMEKSGVTGVIQCSPRFKNKLENVKNDLKVQFIERGEIEIKGMGKMTTFFIEKKNPSSSKL